MYDEAKDFAHHRAEVEEAYATLISMGLEPPESATVLDVGGGRGMHCGFLQRRNASVVCSDILDYTALYDGAFVKLVAEKYARNGMNLDLARCAFIRSDAMQMLFRDGIFDLCVSFNAFEHIPDPSRAFVEIMRVLKPGGVAYVSLDPIWTCDTGSHFSSLVPGPWSHLVLAEDEFRSRMRAAGASDATIAEFPAAMNRKRLADYDRAVKELLEHYPVRLASHDRYSGLSDPESENHPNYAHARQIGYADDELKLRRLRWVLVREPVGPWPHSKSTHARTPDKEPALTV
jgi:SAM-dependent methyltransferase